MGADAQNTQTNQDREAARAYAGRRNGEYQNLAAGAFSKVNGEPVMVAPEPAWPRIAAHDTSGLVLTDRTNVYEHGVKHLSSLAPICSLGPGECDGCYERGILRHSKQLWQEIASGRFYLLEVKTRGEGDKLIARWRGRKRDSRTAYKYIRIAQESGGEILIHNQDREGGSDIPFEPDRIFELLHKIGRTPKGRNISASRGFGGVWQGSRGDGRNKIQHDQKLGRLLQSAAYQEWSPTASVIDAAKALDEKVSKQGRASSDLDPREIWRRLDLANIVRYTRDDSPLTRDQYVAFLEEHCGKYVKPLTSGLTEEIDRHRENLTDSAQGKKDPKELLCKIREKLIGHREREAVPDAEQLEFEAVFGEPRQSQGGQYAT